MSNSDRVVLKLCASCRDVYDASECHPDTFTAQIDVMRESDGPLRYARLHACAHELAAIIVEVAESSLYVRGLVFKAIRPDLQSIL